jgi:hypothetical protein
MASFLFPNADQGMEAGVLRILVEGDLLRVEVSSSTSIHGLGEFRCMDRECGKYSFY